MSISHCNQFPDPSTRSTGVDFEVGRTACDDPAINLKRYVPGYFTMIAWRLSRGAAQHYLAIGGIGIETWRCLVLLKVDRTLSAHRISKELGMDKGSISRCLKTMQASGLITISLDDHDGRLRLATLTSKGDDVHDKVVGVALERERAFLSVLDPSEREVLIALLGRLHDNLPAVEAMTQDYVDAHFPTRTESAEHMST